ncbi:6-hydroxymethylpterin diphosphokinase MptE-like protein [Candidatus Neomarinimicrobiota bacterium]
MKSNQYWEVENDESSADRSILSRLFILYRIVLKKIWSIKASQPGLRYLFASTFLPLTKNERKLREFKDSHAGERCFIIGNGPSLNNLDLKKLQNETTFGVNAIYTNYEKMGFYPSYYVVEDVFVAEDRHAEINAYKHSKKFFGNYLRYCLTPDETTTLLNVIVNYHEYKNFPHFSTNALARVYVGGTVTYLCLQLAFYMGFSEVYLIGFDHNYSIPESALTSKDGSAILSTDDDPNHFNPAYFGKGKRWHDPNVDRMEKALKKAGATFEQHGKKVYNATAGGKLEVFERVEFDSLF